MKTSNIMYQLLSIDKINTTKQLYWVDSVNSEKHVTLVKKRVLSLANTWDTVFYFGHTFVSVGLFSHT